MSNEILARIRSLIYLYFDSLEHRVSQELQYKTDFLLYNGRKISYNDAVIILSLHDKLEIISKIEKELNELLDRLEDL